MKKRQLIFWMVMGVVLVGCGQGKVTRDVSEQPLEKVAKKEGPSSLERMNEEKKAASPKKKVKKPSEQKTDSVYPKEYTTSKGQERYKKIYPGIYVYEKSYSKRDWDLELTRLDFFDTTGQKINSFDIRKNNPYTKETIPTLERGNYNSYIYDSFVPLDTITGKAKYKAEKHFTRSQIPASEGLPVVGYHLLAMSNAIVDWKFTAICLDEKGNILRTFKDLNIDPYAFCMSENKKFFCVGFGGLRGENLTRLRNNGLRIYEIQTGKLVYELKVDERHTIAGPGCDYRYNHGRFSTRGNDFSKDLNRTIYTIDFDNREIYTRLFPYEEQRYIRDADKKGYIMLNKKTGKRWRLSYDKDFTLEKF